MCFASLRLSLVILSQNTCTGVRCNVVVEARVLGILVCHSFVSTEERGRPPAGAGGGGRRDEMKCCTDMKYLDTF